MTNITSAVEVTQADREAAANPLLTPSRVAREHMLSGIMDGNTMLQAFARHRLAALEEAAKVADDYKATGYMSDRERGYCHDHGDEVATAIRALANPPANIEQAG